MKTPLKQFTDKWISDWNSLNLEAILSHYADDVVFTSPKALARLPQTGGTVRGLDQLREYWSPLPDIRPNLKFQLESILETVNGCTLLYRDENGLLVAETMLFNAEGKVCQGIVSHWVSNG